MNHQNTFAKHCVPYLLRAIASVCAVASGVHAVGDSAVSSSLRFVENPTREQGSSTGDVFWRAAIDCGPSVPLSLLVGARVALASDFDLDGAFDAVDTLGVAPTDCDDAGRIALRRRVFATPAVLRASLLTPAGKVAVSHDLLTRGTGSLVRLTRFCAAPQNGEPEWIEIRNVSAYTIPLARVKLEGRALAAAGALEPGASFIVGSDTAELRLWQPGARLVALSSWSNLRNSGDTLRLTRDDGLMLDSVVYPFASSSANSAATTVSATCASFATEGGAAAAAGYALELPTPPTLRRTRVSASGSSGSAAFVITVHAPVDGLYDLTVYDLDGRPLCALARLARGPGTLTLPSPRCPALDPPVTSAGAFTVILHLAPRTAPGVRALLRITP